MIGDSGAPGYSIYRVSTTAPTWNRILIGAFSIEISLQLADFALESSTCASPLPVERWSKVGFMHVKEFFSQVIPFLQLGDLGTLMIMIKVNISLSVVLN